METETKTIRFEEFASHLNTIFDQLQALNEEITVERGGQLFVVKPKAQRRRRARRRFAADDPLFDIIGIGRTEGPTDVSSNKHRYIAEAITSRWESASDTPKEVQIPRPSDAPDDDRPVTGPSDPS